MMKNKIFFFLLITSAITNAQIGTRTLNSGSIFAGNANFDASAPFLANTGVLHSRTNLTTFAFAGADDQGYDGLVLYNTTAGNTPATGAGVGNQAVTKGFYYFDNAGGAGFGNPTTAGTWMPLGGGAAGGTNVSDTPTTSATINGEEELVVRVEGVADGNTTHLDLSAALTTGTVGTFRLAKIFNATTGAAIMEATGAYDSVNNTVVTGNGMINFLLDSGIYTVELYYFAP